MNMELPPELAQTVKSMRLLAALYAKRLIDKHGWTEEDIRQMDDRIHYAVLHGEETPCDLPTNWATRDTDGN
jgi:hypothetical protein